MNLTGLTGMLIYLFFQILLQMRSDMALLTLEDGGPPIQNPSTAAEDARLASLISLDSMLKQIKVLPCNLACHFHVIVMNNI